MNYVVTPTHINLIRPGDTIEVDGHLKTVSPGAIGKGFMGKTLWGDSYRLGTLPVRRAVIKTAMTDEDDEVIDDPGEPYDDPSWLGPEDYEGTGGDPK